MIEEEDSWVTWKLATVVLGIWLYGISYGKEAQEAQGPDADETFEEFQGEVLELTQSELHEGLGEGIGLSLFGGPPWRSIALLYFWASGNEDERQFDGVHGGQGHLDIVDSIKDPTHEHKVQSTVLGYQRMMFIFGNLPFFLSYEAGIVHWKHEFHDLSSTLDQGKLKRKDTGVYLGGNLGATWLTQGHWFWGITIMSLSRSLIIDQGNSAGNSDLNQGMTRNVEKLRTNAGLNLQFGFFF